MLLYYSVYIILIFTYRSCYCCCSVLCCQSVVTGQAPITLERSINLGGVLAREFESRRVVVVVVFTLNRYFYPTSEMLNLFAKTKQLLRAPITAWVSTQFDPSRPGKS